MKEISRNENNPYFRDKNDIKKICAIAFSPLKKIKKFEKVYNVDKVDFVSTVNEE